MSDRRSAALLPAVALVGLFPEGDYQLTWARPDGKVALIRRDDVMYWAEVR